MSQDTSTIVTFRVGSPSAVPVGSGEGVCDACGERVHLSPSSLDFIEAYPETKVTCTDCLDLSQVNKCSALPQTAFELAETTGMTTKQAAEYIKHSTKLMEFIAERLRDHPKSG